VQLVIEEIYAPLTGDFIAILWDESCAPLCCSLGCSVGWLYPSVHTIPEAGPELSLDTSLLPSEAMGLMDGLSSLLSRFAGSKQIQKHLDLWQQRETDLSRMCLWRRPLYLFFLLTPCLA